MPGRLKPQPWVVDTARCTPGCSLNDRNVPFPDLLLQWFCDGNNNTEILAKSDALGHHLSNGAIGRHRSAHLLPAHQVGVFDPFEEASDEKVDHIKVLEQIIARGAKGIAVARIGPDMTLRAMDMFYKLTQGNVMDDFMSALTAAVTADAEDGSVTSEDEAAQALRE